MSANESKSNDWLTLKTDSSSPASFFRMDNWYPAKHPFCIRSGDFVQLESHVHRGHYWNWYLGLTGNYGYYLKDKDSSNQLRLYILDDENGCLKDGDRVYFADKDTLKIQDAYLGIQSTGKWQSHMFLGSKAIGANEIFRIQIPEEPILTDWTPRLRYQD